MYYSTQSQKCCHTPEMLIEFLAVDLSTYMENINRCCTQNLLVVKRSIKWMTFQSRSRSSWKESWRVTIEVPIDGRSTGGIWLSPHRRGRVQRQTTLNKKLLMNERQSLTLKKYDWFESTYEIDLIFVSVRNKFVREWQKTKFKEKKFLSHGLRSFMLLNHRLRG
jgi:hypothetical protein